MQQFMLLLKGKLTSFPIINYCELALIVKCIPAWSLPLILKFSGQLHIYSKCLAECKTYTLSERTAFSLF
uniref:Uncharacterized protein n=1 Tax=Anguilla anguilla TaxID=7936 RepID=A0A0E9U4B8_ANGAN